MARNFSCPNCGAPLDYGGGNQPTVRCPFCNNSVIVPEEIRDAGLPPSAGGSVVLQPGKLKDILDLVQQGNRAAAVQLYQETFGRGERESVIAIQALAEGRPVQIGTVSMDTSAGSAVGAPSNLGRWIGCGIVAFVVLMIVVAVLPAIIAPLALFSAFNSSPFRSSASTASAPTSIPFATLAPRATNTPKPTATPGLATAVAHFGGKGTGAGLFNDPRTLATDGNGNVYVGDYEGGRVQVFDATGKYKTQWKVGDSKTTISSMAADRKGTVYVVADGEILRVEGATGKALGSLQYPDGNRFDSIAVKADGGILAMWYEAQFGLITSIEGHRDDLVRFDSSGKVASVVRGFISSQTGDPELDTELAVDGLGKIYALGATFDNTVFTFTPEGKYVNMFGSQGDQPGQFNSASAIAVDNQSRVCVADENGIQIFDSNGRYVDRFKTDGYAKTIVFDVNNDLLTLGSDQVTRYTLADK